MKAEELTIGSWIKYTDPDSGKSYGCQVKSISYDGRLTIDFGNYIEVNINDIEPLKLTTKMLERIGLRKITVKGDVSKGYAAETDYWIDPHIPGYYMMNEESRLHQSCIVYLPDRHGNAWLWLNSDEGRIECCCNYVHQYQLALRYFGWDDKFQLKDE